jgi:hypothetical protein
LDLGRDEDVFDEGGDDGALAYSFIAAYAYPDWQSVSACRGRASNVWPRSLADVLTRRHFVSASLVDFGKIVIEWVSDLTSNN